MKQKKILISTFSGVKIQLFLFIASIVTALTYGFFNSAKIGDQLIMFMLRSFVVFADFGVFLALGFLVDFKRGTSVVYVLKVIVFLSMSQQAKSSQYDFALTIVGIPFGLVLYYKFTLFLILFTASYIVQISYDQQSYKKQLDEEQKNLLSQQQNSVKEQKYKEETQRTIQRIKESLKYHKEDEFYKKIQIFYFMIYFSTCILVLFPVQEHVVDFTKALQLGENIDFFKSIFNLNILNKEIIWYINFHTIFNVLCFWSIILFGQFKIKKNHPELIKDYILQMPVKFILIQLLSLIILSTMLVMTPISGHSQELRQISLLRVINIQIFGVAYLIHTLLPVFVSFLLIRLYLGQVFYLNRFVSKKYSFHENGEDYENLDYMFYDVVIQNDINKVRYCSIDQKVLIPRHKLKRYTQEQKLKHYVSQNTVLQIQALFQDFMILDLYNKLSRILVVVIFYITLAVFLASMNINDTYIASEDKFFTHVPSILLLIGIFLTNKYESSVNVFYPKIVIYLNKRLSLFLSQHKAYNIIRLSHFYAIIFTIWLYRIYSELFLPTHSSLQLSIKNTLYAFYSSPDLNKNGVISSLLSGWSQYFLTRSDNCDYNLTYLVVDSTMLIAFTTQIFTLRYFYEKNHGKWDTMLVILKVITPFYVSFVFLINMKCLEWSRAFFCIFLCLGIAFMNNNQIQLQRGIKRDDQGNYED